MGSAIASSFSTMTLNQPQTTNWYFDISASSHMTSHSNTLLHISAPRSFTPSSIIVGNASLLPVTTNGSTDLSGSFQLNNVLVSPHIIKNLTSAEFDPACCSMKDLLSRKLIVRCNSSRPLYPPHPPAAQSFVATTASLWNRHLGHPGHEALAKLASFLPTFSDNGGSSLCHACQLGCHIRLPFHSSSSRASRNFELIHYDLWTSPIVSVSGFKYYFLILDDCSHHL